MLKAVRSFAVAASLACAFAASVYANPIVVIDVPRSDTGPVLGQLTVSGWALDPSSTISSVTILIDGVPVGSVGLSVARPDVCAIYTTAPDCLTADMVGWQFLLDTTMYPSGNHLIEARALSTSGGYTTVSSSFTIANWTSSANNPIHISIDTPNGSTTTSYTGQAAFGGWAYDSIGTITAVAISVDNVPVGVASYGASRPDVCKVFGITVGTNCAVGWNYVLDTGLLADGTHTLDVRVTSSGGESMTASTTFVIANYSSSNPLLVDIDTPNSSSTAFTGNNAQFGGWAADLTTGTTVNSVQILVDGVSNGYAFYGGSRPDVCKAFGITVGTTCAVGWNFSLDTTLLPNGTHSLDVIAYASDGTKVTKSTSFSIDNASTSTASTTIIFVDNPNKAAVQGVTNASGWALSTATGVVITQVQIWIDGVFLGDASYHKARPDVCAVAAYGTSADCPNVGWNFAGDTAVLVNGTHTFTAIAYASDGSHALSSTTFTVANGTPSANPILISIDSPNSTSGNLGGNSVAMGGWAIDLDGTIAYVTISVDGAPIGTATTGSRPDVCAAFGNPGGCPNVGWNFVLDTTQFSDGTHTLDVTATANGGPSYTATTTFTVANITSTNPIRLHIDTPNSSTGPLSGTASPIGGWALATNDTINTVTIYVDNAWVGYAVYGGPSGNRPDVCATFGITLSSCPVGWNFDLDTTQFENGTHTLNVVAQTTMGAYETQGASFTVMN